MAVAIEPLESRTVPAQLVHVLGDLTGSVDYSITAHVPGVLDHTGGAWQEHEDLVPSSDDGVEFSAQTLAPPNYIGTFPNSPQSSIHAFVYDGHTSEGNNYFETITAQSGSGWSGFTSASTQLALGTLANPTPIKYQFVPTDEFEQPGELLHIDFQMDAYLGGQIEGNGTETADDATLDYVITYKIGPDDDTATTETFSGRATDLVTGVGGLYDHIQRDILMDVHLGDFVTISVALVGNLDSTTATALGGGASLNANLFFGMDIDSPPPPPIQLGVTAQYNELADEPQNAKAVPRDLQVTSDQFGPYLPGVGLSNKFTVQVTGDNTSGVSSVRFDLGGVEHGNAVRVGSSDKWTFTGDMERLPVGTADLKVDALDSAGGVLQEYVGNIVSKDILDFELQVAADGQDDMLDVEDARFIRDIPDSMSFTGTITGMPIYYRPTFLLLVGTLQQSVTWKSGQNDIQKFTFTKDVGTLPVGDTDVSPLLGGVTISHFHDQVEPLTSVALPAWLSSAAYAYDKSTQAYNFVDAQPALLNEQATLAKTGVKWIDKKLKKLDSVARIQAHLNISAPLDVNQTVDFHASRLDTEATILGKTLWDKTYESSDLNFGGTLDPLTLDPVNLGVTLKNPEQIGDRTFLDQRFDINLIDKLVPSLPDWLVSAKLGLAIKILGSMNVNAGILLTKVGSSIQYVASNTDGTMGTFVTLTAAPEVNVTGSAAIKVLKGYVAEGNLAMTAIANLNLQANARFQGSILAPTIQSADFSALLTIKYRITASAKVVGLGDVVNFDSAAPENGGPDDDVFGPYQLVTLSTSKK